MENINEMLDSDMTLKEILIKLGYSTKPKIVGQRLLFDPNGVLIGQMTAHEIVTYLRNLSS
jgi:hypothetical protein